jgi:hypothetical protein
MINRAHIASMWGDTVNVVSYYAEHGKTEHYDITIKTLRHYIMNIMTLHYLASYETSSTVDYWAP